MKFGHIIVIAASVTSIGILAWMAWPTAIDSTAGDSAARSPTSSGDVPEGAKQRPRPEQTVAVDEASLATPATRQRDLGAVLDETLSDIERATDKGDSPEDALRRAFAPLRDALAAEWGEADADFFIDIMVRTALQGMTWPEIRDSVQARTAQTGRDYSSYLLQAGLESGQISADELTGLLARNGRPMSDGVFLTLLRTGNTLTAAQMAERGLVPNINVYDSISGRNAVAFLIKFDPLGAAGEPSVRAQALERLVKSGLELVPTNGKYHPLDDLLDGVTDSNAAGRLALAQVLSRHGVQPLPRHVQMIDALSNDSTRKQFKTALGG